jgi:hypothetical protein
MNVTREDIIALCGLDEEEVAAIAEHEHLPDVLAAAEAQYLLGADHGSDVIRAMIRDDVRKALARGDRAHAAVLVHVLHRFVAEHPKGT